MQIGGVILRLSTLQCKVYNPFEYLTELRPHFWALLQMVSIKWQTFQKSSIAMSVIVCKVRSRGENSKLILAQLKAGIAQNLSKNINPLHFPQDSQTAPYKL